TPAPDVIDEAVWGAKFLQKMIVNDDNGNARVFCGIFGRRDGQYNRFGYWGVPSGETDNYPGTDDERTVGSLWNVSGEQSYQYHEYGPLFINTAAAMMVSAAIASTANAQAKFTFWDETPWSPNKLVENASRVFDSHLDHYLVDPISARATGNYSIKVSINQDELWPALLASTALHIFFKNAGNASLASFYETISDSIHDSLISKFSIKTNPKYWVPHLALFALWNWEISKNKNLSLALQDLIFGFSNSTLIPAANETGNVFHYFKDDNYFDYWGANIMTSLGSNSLAIALNATLLERNETFSAAYYFNDYYLFAHDNVVDWIMGRNPLGICQIESLGKVNLPTYHHRYNSIPANPRGAVPGAVPNGIGKPPATFALLAQEGDEARAINAGEDIPWFDLNKLNLEDRNQASFRTNEVYITDNAAFLLGYATLRAQSRI
ncbi:MAG: glycoside hydrolase family 9 protein, partial [Promethearchaeota archaeon]